jgi:hypothetical protein
MIGIKPVSVFGFAHSWERKKIQKACQEEYPAIAEEINAPRDRRGLLSLLQDHIIDLNLMQETEEEFSAIPKDEQPDDIEGRPTETDEDEAAIGAR